MELLYSFDTIKSSRLKCKMEFIFGKASLIMKSSLSNLPQIVLGTDSFPSLTLKGGALFCSQSHHNFLFFPVNFNTRNVLQGILRHFLFHLLLPCFPDASDMFSLIWHVHTHLIVPTPYVHSACVVQVVAIIERCHVFVLLLCCCVTDDPEI